METERLLIRRFKPDDWQDLYEYLSQEKVVKYEPYEVFTEEVCKNEAIRRSNDNNFWAVCLKDSGKLIGNIYLSKQEYGTWELGYVFNSNFWGNGYATEAAQAAVSYAFNNSALRVIAMCNPLNEQSWKLLERLGFNREGHLRKNIFFKRDKQGNPIWHDTFIYTILAEDFINAANNTKYITPKYVRIQTRECAYLTGKPRGIFASVHKLLDAGKLTEDEAKQFNYIDHEWFQQELPNPPFYEDDKPGKPVTWFKTATTSHMLNKLQPLMDMLDKNNVPYDVVYSNMPGKIVYEDNWQVAVLE